MPYQTRSRLGGRLANPLWEPTSGDSASFHGDRGDELVASSNNTRLPKSCLQHFIFSKSPLFRCERRQCLHCGSESYYDGQNFLLVKHLFSCPQFPEEEKQQLCSEEPATSSKSSRPRRSYKKEGEPGIAELKSHFHLFNDPEFKHPRARCNYCDAVMIRNRIRKHLATCPRRPGNVALPEPPKVRSRRSFKNEIKVRYGFSSHFHRFQNPRFKKPRAQCKHCNAEMRYISGVLLAHFATCPRCPKDITLPESSRPESPRSVKEKTFKVNTSEKKLLHQQSPRKEELFDIYAHFYLFDDPKFKQSRARCEHCNKEMIQSHKSMQRHLEICFRWPRDALFSGSSASKLSPQNAPKVGVVKLPDSMPEEQSSHSTGSKVELQSPPEHVPEAREVTSLDSSMLKESSSLASDHKSQSARVSKLEVVKPSRSMLKELRSHFLSFKSMGYQKRRAQCRHCGLVSANRVKTFSCHLLKCPKFPSDAALPTIRVCFTCDQWIFRQNLKAHRLDCGGRCRRCYKVVRPHDKETHHKACNFRLCSACQKRIPVSDLEAHRSNCELKACQGCRKPFPLAELENHRPNCDFYQCHRCDKIRIPKKDAPLHLQACLQFKRCRPCRRMYPIDSFNEHRLSCIFRVCYDCGQKRIPAQELQRHWSICRYVRCHICRERVPKDENIHVCTSVRCSLCHLKIPLDEHSKHNSNCKFIKCYGCCSRFPDTAAFQEHVAYCSGPLGQPAQTFDAGQVSKTLLDRRTEFPGFPSIRRVMKGWSTHPSKVIIVDFEYDSRILPIMRHEAVFQIAIINACGDWIVPPVSINHGISTSQLQEKVSSTLSSLPRRGRINIPRTTIHRQLVKFYGTIGEDETPGHSWAEIADILESYTKVYP